MNEKEIKTADPIETPEFEEGVVKWFNESKGYGFIERPNGRDLFVHYKEIRGKLTQGDQVRYQIGQAKTGPCAAKVKLLKSGGRD